MSSSSSATYILYQMTPFETLATSTDYIFRITTQNNVANEGIPFPTSMGVYKIEYQAQYSSGNAAVAFASTFIEVVGTPFSTLNIYSTVTIPGEKNLIMI